MLNVEGSAPRRCLRLKMSLRDLTETMVERDLSTTRPTIMPRVRRHVPKFKKPWRLFAGATGQPGGSTRYIKIRGKGFVSIAG